MSSSRETLGSRLGFLLLSAGCAVGLGNVWRFPFICGKFGGALFLLMYLAFLVLLGFPVLIMELSVGRASRRTLFGAPAVLAPHSRVPWKPIAAILFSGSAILMSYYTTVTGWLFAWTTNYLDGSLANLHEAYNIGKAFDDLTGSANYTVGFMLVAVLLGTIVCAVGLRRGVENVTKYLMGGLFLLLILLGIWVATLPNAQEGFAFYLEPSLEAFTLKGVIAALNQAFFTLSIGIGSMEIFGSYAAKDRSLASETIAIILLDTLVAFLAGCVIFPACASSGVAVNAGPGLIFVSLPGVFNGMPAGRWLGMLFFFFMSLAAFTTVVAVFENLVAFLIDECHLPRKAAAWINGALIAVLSLPCAFGFNLWKSCQPLGEGSTILDLEDCIVSGCLLPIGGIFFALFCTCKFGWGWPGFLAEANTGKGWKLPNFTKLYFQWIIPLLIITIFAISLYELIVK